MFTYSRRATDASLSTQLRISVTYTYVQGYCGQRNFIAAQTPMKNTEGDVWEMIWMEKCAAVVVLCNFTNTVYINHAVHGNHM